MLEVLAVGVEGAAVSHRLVGWDDGNPFFRLMGEADQAAHWSDWRTQSSLQHKAPAGAIHGRKTQADANLPVVCGFSAIVPGGPPQPGYWKGGTNPAFNLIHVPGSLQGRAVRMNSLGRMVGHVVQSMTMFKRPFCFEHGFGMELVVGPGNVQGEAQAIADGSASTVAGWVATEAGQHKVCYWLRDQQGTYGLPQYLADGAGQVTGSVTEVYDAGTEVIVYGYTDENPGRLFVWSSTSGMKRLGRPGEAGPPAHSVSGAFVGTNPSEPYIFVVPSDAAEGSGLADDLDAVLAPQQPAPASTSLVTGVAGTVGNAWNMGGTGLGTTNGFWVAKPGEDLWTVPNSHTVSTPSFLNGTTGADSADVDGKAMVLTKLLAPDTTVPVQYTVEEQFQDPVSGPLFFRTTQRFNWPTGFERHVTFFKWSTNAFDTMNTVSIPEKDFMRTWDIIVGPEYLSQDLKVKALVQTKQVGPASQPIYKLEVEQARCLWRVD